MLEKVGGLSEINLCTTLAANTRLSPGAQNRAWREAPRFILGRFCVGYAYLRRISCKQLFLTDFPTLSAHRGAYFRNKIVRPQIDSVRLILSRIMLRGASHRLEGCCVAPHSEAPKLWVAESASDRGSVLKAARIKNGVSKGTSGTGKP